MSLAQATFVTAGGLAAGWALNYDWGVDLPFVASNGQLNFLLAALIGAVGGAAAGHAGRVAGTQARGGEPRHRHAGVGVRGRRPRVRAGRLQQPDQRLVDPHSDARPARRQLGQRPPARGPSAVRRPLAGPGPDPGDAGALRCRHRDRLRGHPLPFGARRVRGAQLGGRGRGVRHQIGPHQGPALRVLGAIAGFAGAFLGMQTFIFTDKSAPPYVTLFWLSLAVTFGIRRPGGALLAGMALACSPAIFHWLASDILPQGAVSDLVGSTYFVPILSGLGAIQLAQEPDGVLALAGQQRLAKRRKKERAAAIAAAAADVHHGAVPDTDAVTHAGRHRGRDRRGRRARPRPRGRRLRRRRGAARRVTRRRTGADRRIARRERRGQVDVLLGGERPGGALRRSCPRRRRRRDQRRCRSTAPADSASSSCPRHAGSSRVSASRTT